MKPYVAIYSTFLQRAFDQIATDVCLNALPVTFLIDRAGLVGADGVTHQGVFDLSYLAMLPNMVVAAPRDVRDLKRLIRLSAEYEGPMAIRYPKDSEDLGARLETHKPLRVGEWELLTDGEDVVFFAVGRMVQSALNACIELMHHGVRAGVVDARFVKPLDGDMLRASLKAPLWVTVEEKCAFRRPGRARAFVGCKERARPCGHDALRAGPLYRTCPRAKPAARLRPRRCQPCRERAGGGWTDEKAPRRRAPL